MVRYYSVTSASGRATSATDMVPILFHFCIAVPGVRRRFAGAGTFGAFPLVQVIREKDCNEHDRWRASATNFCKGKVLAGVHDGHSA